MMVSHDQDHIANRGRAGGWFFFFSRMKKKRESLVSNG